MRWLGAFILVTTAAALGHLVASERERRVHQLAALVHGLHQLETEIVYGLSLLSDAFERVAVSHPECAALFAEASRTLKRGAGVGVAWAAGVDAVARGTALDREDIRPLVKLGGILGLASAEDQRRHIRLAQSEVESRLSEARRKLPDISRLYRTLGVCGGLIVALLLI